MCQAEETKIKQTLMDLEKARDEVKTRVKEAENKLKEKQAETLQEREKLKQLHKRMKDQEKKFEGCKAEKQEATEKFEKFKKDLGELNKELETLTETTNENRKNLKEKEDYSAQLKRDLTQFEVQKENLRSKQQEYQEIYLSGIKEIDGLKSQIDKLDTEIDVLRIENDSLKRQIESCNREENAQLNKREQKNQRVSIDKGVLRMYGDQAHNVDIEVSVIKTHIQDFQKSIFNIEQEKQNYYQELSNSTSQYLHAQEVLKEVQEQVEKKGLEILEGDRRVKQQQTLYDKVRNEREKASKTSKEIQLQIENLTSNFERLLNGIKQHKSAILRKDKELMKDKHTLEFINDEIERVREKRLELRTQNEIAKNAIKAQTGELAKLEEDIRNYDDQFKRNKILFLMRKENEMMQVMLKLSEINKLDNLIMS
jgi:chromosome segregation ATPase